MAAVPHPPFILFASMRSVEGTACSQTRGQRLREGRSWEEPRPPNLRSELFLPDSLSLKAGTPGRLPSWPKIALKLEDLAHILFIVQALSAECVFFIYNPVRTSCCFPVTCSNHAKTELPSQLRLIITASCRHFPTTQDKGQSLQVTATPWSSIWCVPIRVRSCNRDQ